MAITEICPPNARCLLVSNDSSRAASLPRCKGRGDASCTAVRLSLECVLLATFCLTSLCARQSLAIEPAFNDILSVLPPGTRPRVVVPGGYTRQAPANTARPLVMAIEDGLDAVELDVRRTKDGQHVIFDVDELAGRTSGAGKPSDYTLAELQALDAGSWFAPRFTGDKILSLAEALELARNKIALVLVCRDVDPAQFARELAASTAQIIVTGAPTQVAEIVKAAGGKIATVTTAQSPAAEAKVASVQASEATPELCRSLHERQLTVMADSTGEADDVPSSWDKLVASGVDLVRTNRPEEFVVHTIRQRLPKPPVQYAAHRGALRYAPENTQAALAEAVRLHADFVEIDVQTTSDGAHFLLHDGTLDRTTGGKGRVRQATAETLRGLDAGGWFGLPFAGAPVPELDPYLARFPAEMGLYFDAKDITPEALAQAVERHGLVDRTVVYQGPVYLEKLKQINPAIRLLAPVAAASHVDTVAKRFQPYAVDANWRLLSREFIAHCHELNIKVFSDAKGDTTVEQYRQAIDWGIDLIQTDHPLRLWRAMEQAAAK